MSARNRPVSCSRRVKGGIAIAVRATPKSKSARITGLIHFGDREFLKASLTSAPENGRANAELERLIAGWLDTPASCVSVSGGHKSRTKTVSVSGDPDCLEDKLLSRRADIR